MIFSKQIRLIIFHHDPLLYGASLSILTLIEGLLKKGVFDILVLLPRRGPMQENLEAIGVNYKIVSYPWCVSRSTLSIKNKLKNILNYINREYRVLPDLLKTCKEFQPDLIYTNTSVLTVGYILSKRLKVPHIWHVREFGDLDYNFQYLPFRFMMRYYMNRSDCVIFVSEVLRKHWVKRQRKHHVVIYNGILLDIMKPVFIKQPQRKKWKFGLVGSIIRTKGQDVAIKAFSLLAAFHPFSELHFYGGVGDNNFYKELEALICLTDLSKKVFFHPYTEDHQQVYGDLDVVLSCSKNEAFGRTIIEAMSRGMPVIANASGGPTEIIIDRINGLLYHNSPNSLLNAIRLIMEDDQLYSSISLNATNDYFKKYTTEKYVNNISDLIFSVIKNPS